jgi:hypothetical protein
MLTTTHLQLIFLEGVPMRFRSAAAVGALVLVLGFSAPAPAGAQQPAPAATAGPAASCFGYSCSGLGPQKTGCGKDAQIVASRPSDNGGVVLMYSRTCQSNWAAVTGAPVGTEFWVENTSGQKQSWKADGDTWTWSTMIDGSNGVHDRACIEVGCTAWV